MYFDSGQFGLLSPRTPLVPIQCTTLIKTPGAYLRRKVFFCIIFFFQPRCSTRETKIRLPPFYSKHIPPLNFCSLQLHFLPLSVSRSVMSYPHLFIIFHLQTTTWTLKETRNLSASVWSPKWIHNNNHAQ